MVRQSAAPDAPVDAPVGDPVAERVHTQLAPIAPRERILVLDVLRGFALCGVLIGNLFWLYSGRGWNHPPDDGPLDPAARWFVELVVQSKAQTLLCFLFGFGFAAQLVRAERGETVFHPVSLLRSPREALGYTESLASLAGSR